MAAMTTSRSEGGPRRHVRNSKSIDISRWEAPSMAQSMDKRASLDLSRPLHSSSRNVYSPTFLRSPTIDFARPIVGQRQTLPTPEELVQERAFRKWLNGRLEQQGFEPMANLATDLSDGVNLLRLLEILSTETLPRWNAQPRMRVQRAENLDIALKFIAGKGIILTNISAEDILDSNLKLILGLVWTLLFRFSVQPLASDGVNAKDALLLWVQEKISGYDVPCEDWSRSFTDGRVLCALIHAHKSTAFGWKEVEHLTDDGRVAMAFDVAHTLFRVPRSLEVRDLVRTKQESRPDEKVVMTYVASLYEAFKATQIAETSAERLSAFLDQVEGVWRAQSDYETRAAELLQVLNDVRNLWRKERSPQSFEEASTKLNLTRDPASRCRLRDERRSLASLHARICTKIATYGLAAWRCPQDLAPAALTSEIQTFFGEEDARRGIFADYILQCQEEARRALVDRCAEAVDALDGLAHRIDILSSSSDLERYAKKLSACKADLANLDTELQAVRDAEARCEAMQALPLHASLHTAAGLHLEREQLIAMLDERIAFSRTQVTLRRKADELTPAEMERAEMAWRHASQGLDVLDRGALSDALATPELALVLSDAEVDAAYDELASPDGMAFDAFLTLLRRQRGPAGVRRAFEALTTADMSLDFASLPKMTAERLKAIVPCRADGTSDVEAVLRRAYG